MRKDLGNYRKMGPQCSAATDNTISRVFLSSPKHVLKKLCDFYTFLNEVPKIQFSDSSWKNNILRKNSQIN